MQVRLMATHKQYWQKRIIETAHNRYDMSVDEMLKQTKRIYEDMQDWMAEEIDRIYFKLLEDDITRTDIWTYKHYRDLSKRIALNVARIGAKEEEILNVQLELALKEIYKETPIPGTSFSLINETVVRQLIATPWSEKHFSQAVWDNKAKMLEILKGGLTKSIVLGESKDKTVARIRDLILSTNKDKGFKGAFADADRLVRTELQHTVVQGQIQRYQDNEYKQLEIVVADDERLCEKCAALDGKIVPIDSDEVPPFHSRCRCDVIPVIDWQVVRLKIYVVTSGVYEDKDTYLVTTNLDTALNILKECESPNIEVQEDDDCLLVYGFQQSDEINKTKDVAKIKCDLLNQLEGEV